MSGEQTGSEQASSAAATALERVRADLGDCRRCKLCQRRRNIVFGVGDPDADLVVVGEAPGYHEDQQGEPFAGPTVGPLLDAMLASIGMDRRRVYLVDVVKCRPPDNRNPQPDELEACRPFLDRQLAAIGPKLILVLGAVAYRALFRTEQGIKRARGRWHEFDGVPVMPTFHPAYLVRQPEDLAVALEDFALAGKRLAASGVKLGEPVPFQRTRVGEWEVAEAGLEWCDCSVDGDASLSCPNCRSGRSMSGNRASRLVDLAAAGGHFCEDAGGSGTWVEFGYGCPCGEDPSHLAPGDEVDAKAVSAFLASPYGRAEVARKSAELQRAWSAKASVEIDARRAERLIEMAAAGGHACDGDDEPRWETFGYGCCCGSDPGHLVGMPDAAVVAAFLESKRDEIRRREAELSAWLSRERAAATGARVVRAPAIARSEKADRAPPVRVYLAGKIERAREGWRRGWQELWSATTAPSTGRHEREVGAIADRNVVYVGPFTYGCSHGCSHGPTKHGLGESCNGHSQTHPQVFGRSLAGIEHADLVIARPTADAHGTLVEIGYARALNKQIVVDLSLAGDAAAELWFAAQAHNCTDPHLYKVATEILGSNASAWGAHASEPDLGELLCESPIERSLYRELRKLGLEVQLQTKIGRYRADLMIGDLVIECDGHAYHSTKEQRTHDAERDRKLVAAGYRVIRFTGTEIHKDPASCARQVADIVRAT